MLYSIDNIAPDCNQANFIAPNATVIGNVQVEKDVSIWFNVVIRGDNDPIKIGAGSNVQDGSILHTDIGAPLTIGKMDHCRSQSDASWLFHQRSLPYWDQ